MAKYNYMSEYLQALYSTFAFFKTTEMSPLMKHNNTMTQKDEWWKMKQNEYGNSFSNKNFVHQMIVDLFQTVVRHAFLNALKKFNFAVEMFVKCCALGHEELFFRGRVFLHKNYIFYYVTKIFEIQCPVTQHFLTLLRAPTVAHSC